MRLRIQCLLIVLLFTAAGVLCRQQRADAQAVQTTAQFTQPTDVHTVNTFRYFAHSMLASDMVNSVLPENNSKAPVKDLDIQGGGICPKPASGILRSLSSADLHPDPAAYYIYSLGRIRI